MGVAIGGGTAQAMQIYVKTLAGNVITLEVSGTDTIANMKQKISDKEGIPTNQQRLVFDTKQLDEDDKTLDQCGIKRENTIYIVLKDVERPVKKPETAAAKAQGQGRHRCSLL